MLVLSISKNRLNQPKSCRTRSVESTGVFQLFGQLCSCCDGGHAPLRLRAPRTSSHFRPNIARLSAARYAAAGPGPLAYSRQQSDRHGLQSPPIAAAARIAQPESNQMTLPFRLRKIFEEGPCVTYYPIIEILNPTRLQVDFNSQVFVPEDLL